MPKKVVEQRLSHAGLIKDLGFRCTAQRKPKVNSIPHYGAK